MNHECAWDYYTVLKNIHCIFMIFFYSYMEFPSAMKFHLSKNIILVNEEENYLIEASKIIDKYF